MMKDMEWNGDDNIRLIFRSGGVISFKLTYPKRLLDRFKKDKSRFLVEGDFALNMEEVEFVQIRK